MSEKAVFTFFGKDGFTVGVTGIEPMTSPTRTERATKLRHTPNALAL